MDLERGWYEEINEEAERQAEQMFYNESEVSDSFGRLMYAMKGELSCSIVYVDDDDTAVEIYGRVVRIRESRIEILEDGAVP